MVTQKLVVVFGFFFLPRPQILQINIVIMLSEPFSSPNLPLAVLVQLPLKAVAVVCAFICCPKGRKGKFN